MRAALKIREFSSHYQQLLKLDFNSRLAVLEHEIKPLRQASSSIDAATLNHLLQINGYISAQDSRARQGQTLKQNSAKTDLS